ncbi:Tetratricopeptide-like helical [Penicillium atrosanguineum]|uniref:Tetratricopeptide-like helical n=1 Tax=Penicillium atrosanguineum TaxID=1132637 RepID=UPI002386AD7D|nr:Tetratricopeptide-like helical [Penicillium atrosanguineum]KAJ5314517.1 Tetratricopeptide-like helical [Penicillium atrosanguineum]
MAESFNLLDASISDLKDALSSGRLTSVDLVSRYIRRINIYDANGLKLSAIPILNPFVFDEAAASDARRANGFPPRPLEGIPYLVKDNIKVKGMSVANGSPAFENLVANEDAACVQLLRNAGAVLLGRTNMPAMAYGGMQRGVWGRAESPYNGDYLAAAYASGSSNGSAVATAANLCAFSLGTETVSSGRSPASNNAVVAYTPSKGLLPLRGVFPLYPTCDVLVPHTRTVADLFHVLDVLAVSDPTPRGDFYNEQKVVSIPSIADVRPESFSALQETSSLRGKRIGVPSMYIGGDDSSIQPISKVQTRESIIKLWQEARKTLEACGAEVIETDFPLVTEYEANAASGQLVTVANLLDGWAGNERCEVVSHAWDDFLVANGQKGLNSLTLVDPNTIFPLAPGSLLGTPEVANKPRWREIVQYPHTKPSSIFEIPGMKQAIQALEDARTETFEKWMDKLGLDAVVFPSTADVGAANADVDKDASLFAWSNGVKYSNGNRPIRHLGVPTISVPMGVMEDTEMPVNLTFAGKAYEDNCLLKYGYAYEMASKCRVLPPLVPALDSDCILDRKSLSPHGLELVVETQVKKVRGSDVVVEVEGSSKGAVLKSVVCYVNGQPCDTALNNRKWSAKSSYPVSDRDGKWEKWASPTLKQTIVVVTGYAEGGSAAGKLIIL